MEAVRLSFRFAAAVAARTWTIKKMVAFLADLGVGQLRLFKETLTVSVCLCNSGLFRERGGHFRVNHIMLKLPDQTSLLYTKGTSYLFLERTVCTLAFPK